MRTFAKRWSYRPEDMKDIILRIEHCSQFFDCDVFNVYYTGRKALDKNKCYGPFECYKVQLKNGKISYPDDTHKEYSEVVRKAVERYIIDSKDQESVPEDIVRIKCWDYYEHPCRRYAIRYGDVNEYHIAVYPGYYSSIRYTDPSYKYIPREIIELVEAYFDDNNKYGKEN